MLTFILGCCVRNTTWNNYFFFPRKINYSFKDASWNSPLLLSPSCSFMAWYNGLLTATAVFFLIAMGYPGLEVRLQFHKQLSGFNGWTLLKGWYFIFDIPSSNDLCQTFIWASWTCQLSRSLFTSLIGSLTSWKSAWFTSGTNLSKGLPNVKVSSSKRAVGQFHVTG